MFKKTARCNAGAQNVHLMLVYRNMETSCVCVPNSLSFPHTLNLFICGFRCGYRQWKLKGWRFLGHLPDAVGSFRWICLLTTKPWALWLTLPFSSTGTGESNIKLFWWSLQGFALLSMVSSLIANQFGGLPGRRSIHLYHFVSGIIQGHSDILKRLKRVHVNWGLLSRKLLLV